MPHKLLLADDSVTIQRVIELTFADEDIQVIAVGDGQQAIDRVQRTGRTSCWPTSECRSVTAMKSPRSSRAPELAHIPVLLLTGAFEPIDEARAQAAGCDGVLVKPFEPQMVISRVKDLIAAPTFSATTSAAAAAVDWACTRLRWPPANLRRPVASRDTSAPGAAPAASVEEYFDRLDAAFSSLDTSAILGGPPRRRASDDCTSGRFRASLHVAACGDPLADWDPDLGSDASAVKSPRDRSTLAGRRRLTPLHRLRRPTTARCPP